MTKTAEDDISAVVPLAEEVVLVGKRSLDTGTVRVSVTTATVEDVVRETLRSRRAEVVRVPIDREVTEAPETPARG